MGFSVPPLESTWSLNFLAISELKIPLFLKVGEGIGIQNLGPFIAVVAGRVPPLKNMGKGSAHTSF